MKFIYSFNKPVKKNNISKTFHHSYREKTPKAHVIMYSLFEIDRKMRYLVQTNDIGLFTNLSPGKYVVKAFSKHVYASSSSGTIKVQTSSKFPFLYHHHRPRNHHTDHRRFLQKEPFPPHIINDIQSNADDADENADKSANSIDVNTFHELHHFTKEKEVPWAEDQNEITKDEYLIESKKHFKYSNLSPFPLPLKIHNSLSLQKSRHFLPHHRRSISQWQPCEAETDPFNIQKDEFLSVKITTITETEGCVEQYGSVIVNATGGVQPHIVFVENEEIRVKGNRILRVPKGNHTVVVVDNIGCRAAVNLVIHRNVRCDDFLYNMWSRGGMPGTIIIAITLFVCIVVTRTMISVSHRNEKEEVTMLKARKMELLLFRARQERQRRKEEEKERFERHKRRHEERKRRRREKMRKKKEERRQMLQKNTRFSITQHPNIHDFRSVLPSHRTSLNTCFLNDVQHSLLSILPYNNYYDLVPMGAHNAPFPGMTEPIPDTIIRKVNAFGAADSEKGKTLATKPNELSLKTGSTTFLVDRTQTHPTDKNDLESCSDKKEKHESNASTETTINGSTDDPPDSNSVENRNSIRREDSKSHKENIGNNSNDSHITNVDKKLNEDRNEKRKDGEDDEAEKEIYDEDENKNKGSKKISPKEDKMVVIINTSNKVKDEGNSIENSGTESQNETEDNIFI